MEVHILSHWSIGCGEDIVGVYRDVSDAIAEAERIVADFNVNNPGRKMDGSRYVAERVSRAELVGEKRLTAAWVTGVSGWRIETWDVR
jgi:hypothetical protein